MSRQSDANARSSAETLVRYGVLVVLGAATRLALATAEEWQPTVEEARRQLEAGRLIGGQRLLLIDPSDANSFYRFLADQDRPDPRMMWAARAPDSTETAIVVALDPDLDEDAAVRLDAELREAGLAPKGLKLGRMASFGELRGFAAESLPGAFPDRA